MVVGCGCSPSSTIVYTVEKKFLWKTSVCKWQCCIHCHVAGYFFSSKLRLEFATLVFEQSWRAKKSEMIAFLHFLKRLFFLFTFNRSICMELASFDFLAVSVSLFRRNWTDGIIPNFYVSRFHSTINYVSNFKKSYCRDMNTIFKCFSKEECCSQFGGRWTQPSNNSMFNCKRSYEFLWMYS